MAHYRHWLSRMGTAAYTLLLAVSLAHPPVHAHSDKPQPLYVAETGRDVGDCQNQKQPCRSLEYAMSKAGKGTSIKVAAGTYTFRPDTPEEGVQLVSPIISVEGGFDPSGEFTKATGTAARTMVQGPAQRFREALTRRGLTLVPADEQTQAGPRRVAQAVRAAATVRYVAAEGTDVGNCTNPLAPCASIGYAADQARTGEEIRVATGAFELEPSLLTQLRQKRVQLRGGFSAATGLRARAADDEPTYILGAPFSERAALAANGFVLVQDQKAFDILRSTARPRAAVERLQGPVMCVGGMAGPYPCKGMQLLSHMPLSAFSGNPSGANDIWGFKDLNDGNEYAIIGLRNGTAVVNVSDPVSPQEVGTIPGFDSIWRDIKVYQFFDRAANRWKAYAYVTTDAATQGLHIIDLTGLPASISLAATYNDFASAHNVYMANIEYATGKALPGMQPFAYILGANVSGGAYRILDLTTPTAPIVVTTPPIGHGYTHDASNIVITDARTAQCASGHNPCEILMDYNETTLDLWDVTDKHSPLKLGSMTYPNAKYVHSGWGSKDKRYVFLQDELDEKNAALNTTLYVVDIADLSDPKLAGAWTGSTRAIDHNGFTLGDEYYMSNYRRGLTVLDVSDPKVPVETRFFDTFPNPPANSAEFNGAWGVFPYLPSEIILVSDIEGGLMVLKKQAEDPTTPPAKQADIAFAWANEPTSASYAPSITYAWNPKGEIAVTRSSTGHYAVRFKGFGGKDKAGGHVQVSAYGQTPEHCKVWGWSSSGTDFVVSVRCFQPGGSPADARYTVWVIWPR